MVSAELAVALPALVAVAVALAWLLALGGLQAVAAQAAREGARAAARGEGAEQAQAAARALAPRASVTVQRSGRWVEVTVTMRGAGARGLPARWSPQVRASAVTWAEDR